MSEEEFGCGGVDSAEDYLGSDGLIIMFIAVGVPFSPPEIGIKPLGQLKGAGIRVAIGLFSVSDEGEW